MAKERLKRFRLKVISDEHDQDGNSADTGWVHRVL